MLYSTSFSTPVLEFGRPKMPVSGPIPKHPSTSRGTKYCGTDSPNLPTAGFLLSQPFFFQNEVQCDHHSNNKDSNLSPSAASQSNTPHAATSTQRALYAIPILPSADSVRLQIPASVPVQATRITTHSYC